MSNISIANRLSSDLLKIFSLITDHFKSIDVDLYLVGGLVRDYFLNKKLKDLDFVFNGDATTYAKQFFETYQASNKLNDFKVCKIITFNKYKTSKIEFQNSDKSIVNVDFASARKEIYEHPGANPKVQLCSIEEDFKRRDFSINAIALEIFLVSRQVIIDPFLGLNDLKAKSLRVLHDNSFLDDPARLIRGLRFKNRFNFTFEANTKKHFDYAVRAKVIEKLPFQRFMSEFCKALTEENLKSLLYDLEQIEVLNIIHPKLRIDSNVDFECEIKEKTDMSTKWLRPFCAISKNLTLSELEDLCTKAKFSKDNIERLKNLRH